MYSYSSRAYGQIDNYMERPRFYSISTTYIDYEKFKEVSCCNDYVTYNNINCLLEDNIYGKPIDHILFRLLDNKWSNYKLLVLLNVLNYLALSNNNTNYSIQIKDYIENLDIYLNPVPPLLISSSCNNLFDLNDDSGSEISYISAFSEEIYYSSE